MADYIYLPQINSPEDIKKLSEQGLNVVAQEIRRVFLEKTSANGGHLGSNLGIVELTIALHYVFNSPMDKIVYDTSHQTYTHKILTGRAQAFLYPEHYKDVVGYSSTEESAHDHFTIGHTSTSISLAMGLCKGRDVYGGSENIIAIIGDGALSGGEALEGLNCAGEYDGNLIIVLNDNDQSIQENHGGIYKNLRLLRETKGQATNNWFTAQGLDYIYEENGNDIRALIRLFEKIKDTAKPIVVHLHTCKGKGYAFAESTPEEWHYTSPFSVETGIRIRSSRKTYYDITAQFLLQKAKEKPELMVLTAGTASVMGLTPQMRNELGRQYVDSGIAEEHTAALASGIATRGGIPIWGTLGTFFQRSYDQFMQDIALNKAPVILLFFGCGSYGLSDVTHTCLYDIAMLSSIPNMDYVAPTCYDEYIGMLTWFTDNIRENGRPVAIRVPGVHVLRRNIQEVCPLQRNKFVIEQKGKEVAIIAVGNFFSRAEAIIDELRQQGINPTLINPRYVSGLDEEVLDSLRKEHSLVVTLEDGMIEGGFGEKVARYYGTSDMRVLVKGHPKSFCDCTDVDTLLTQNGLQMDQLVNEILGLMR